MAGAKSLVVLCFLLVIVSSQAASCRFNRCYRRCRRAGISPPICARRCHCTLPATFAPNELGRKAMMTTEEQPAAEMEDDNNSAEAVLEEMIMMEELISLDDKLEPERRVRCRHQPCYRACRARGGGRHFCARRCRCILGMVEPAEEGTDMKDVDDEASTAATE